MSTAFTATPSGIVRPNMRVTIGGTAMGLTVGGVEIEHKTDWLKVTNDQYGTSPVQMFNLGDDVIIRFGLAEFSYANLNRALGTTSTLRQTGGTAVGLGGLFAASKVGTTVAVALIFHPLDELDSSLVDDVNVWKAICVKCEPIQYGGLGKGELILMTEWHTILDTSKTAGKMAIDHGLAAAT